MFPKNKQQNGFAKSKRPRIITVASGKGGVGKSTFSLVSAVELAKTFKVLLVGYNFSNDYFSLLWPENKNFVPNVYRASQDLMEFIQKTRIKNLALLNLNAVYPNNHQNIIWEKHRLFKSLRTIPVDLIIMDLGTANNFNVIDLFIKGDETIVLSQDGPFSISRTEQFLKTCQIRRLQKSFKHSPEMCKKYENYIEQYWLGGNDINLLLNKNKNLSTTMKLLIYRHIASFRPKLVLTFVDDKDHFEKNNMLKNDKQILYKNCEILGNISYDRTVRSIFREGHVFQIDLLKSPAIYDIRKIVERLLNKIYSINLKKTEEVYEQPNRIMVKKQRPINEKKQPIKRYLSCKVHLDLNYIYFEHTI
jgi:MinD-like ATPase involved in chromosome partitioning or flagellar assembly